LADEDDHGADGAAAAAARVLCSNCLSETTTNIVDFGPNQQTG